MDKLINSFEKLGYSLRYSDESDILFHNSFDDIISVDLSKRTVSKYWCDCPVDFNFDEISILYHFFVRYFKE